MTPVKMCCKYMHSDINRQTRAKPVRHARPILLTSQPKLSVPLLPSRFLTTGGPQQPTDRLSLSEALSRTSSSMSHLGNKFQLSAARLKRYHALLVALMLVRSGIHALVRLFLGFPTVITLTTRHYLALPVKAAPAMWLSLLLPYIRTDRLSPITSSATSVTRKRNGKSRPPLQHLSSNEKSLGIQYLHQLPVCLELKRISSPRLLLMDGRSRLRIHRMAPITVTGLVSHRFLQQLLRSIKLTATTLHTSTPEPHR
jgi:hypothetical protein